MELIDASLYYYFYSLNKVIYINIIYKKKIKVFGAVRIIIKIPTK